MKRWIFHSLIALLPAGVVGWLGFMLASPIIHDVTVRWHTACRDCAIVFSTIFFPLSFYYGFGSKSPMSRPYRGSLIRFFCKLFRIENVDSKDSNIDRRP